MKLTLSMVCIVLLALFAYQVMSYPMNMDENKASKKFDDGFALTEDYELPMLTVLKDIQQYSEIITRPLFEKDRTGTVKSRKVSKASDVNQLSHLILVGTALSTDTQIGIVADPKEKKIQRFKVGENYKDWSIVGVFADHILFENAQLKHKLYVTPINRRSRQQQAKLISDFNKNKNVHISSQVNQHQDDLEEDTDVVRDRSIQGRSWGYNKNHAQSKQRNEENKHELTTLEKKSAIKSPIKIPIEEEKNSEFYEGFGEDDDLDLEQLEFVESEIDAEDFYDDSDDISEEELKALESLGAKLFDD